MNRDGFGDIVVLATGVSPKRLYFYTGSASGIVTTPSRVITPPSGSVFYSTVAGAQRLVGRFN